MSSTLTALILLVGLLVTGVAITSQSNNIPLTLLNLGGILALVGGLGFALYVIKMFRSYT